MSRYEVSPLILTALQGNWSESRCLLSSERLAPDGVARITPTANQNTAYFNQICLKCQ